MQLAGAVLQSAHPPSLEIERSMPDTNSEREPLRAFVLSPIDAGEFDELYRGVIRPTLEAQGVKVGRADELDLQNIMAAVVRGITTAHIIIAEITTRNPNVMYELGVAHALEKPVIILTQDIEQVPFDLRAYRVIRYSPHFAAIGSLTKTLEELVSALRDGNLSYSSPIADFAGHDSASEPTGDSLDDERVAPPPAPLELWDHLARIEDLMDELNVGTVAAGAAADEVGAKMEQRTTELSRRSRDSASMLAERRMASSVCVTALREFAT